MNRLRQHTRYRFPWREQNRFTLLVDAPAFFTDMLQSIGQATRFIYLEMYLIQSGAVVDRFLDALERARTRQIDIYLLLDDYGALGLNAVDRQRIRNMGTHLYFYNPLHYGSLRRNLFRDHRKIMIVDGRIAYTGGVGITDEFDPAHDPHLYWHDAMVRVEGQCAQDWQTLFEENWKRWADREIRQKSLDFDIPEPAQAGHVVESRSFTHSEVVRSFVHHIRAAERRAWLATAYFVPSRKLRRTLARAARNGTDVRIMLPGRHTDHPWARHMGRRFYERLLRDGVRIYEYQPRFVHLKILLCDHWVSIGSSNVDRWNLRWNLEANQEVDDPDFALSIQRLLEQDLAECHEILLEHWQHRSWHTRIRIWFWSKVVAFLSWFSLDRKGK
jgi:phosphatidylserine/phosphatidylglycerophosphate/cardiolipin synthase-like enzyme